MASVLVLGELDDGALTATSAAQLGAATRLSGDLGGGVACAVIGGSGAGAGDAAIAAGADTVYVAEAEGLATYQIETYLPVLQGVVEQDGPKVVLLAQSSIGRDLAPRLATRLGSAAVMDALSLEMVNSLLRAGSRACTGSRASSVSRCAALSSLSPARNMAATRGRL